MIVLLAARECQTDPLDIVAVAFPFCFLAGCLFLAWLMLR